MDDEFDLQRVGRGIVAARCVIAGGDLRLGAGGISVRKEQLYVIVEAETGEAFQIAAERDADQMRRDGVDALDFQFAAARLVPDAARRARIGVVRCGGSSN